MIKNRKRFLIWFWTICFSPVVLIFGWILAVGLFTDIPSFTELEDPKSNLSTEVISSDSEILSTFHIENRSYISYAELSPNLVSAIVATEDVRFYNHSGIDFRSLARVGVKSLIMGNRRSGGGGSTLSQQLAKTLFPRETEVSNFPGAKYFLLANNKFREWITAVKLERNYTKNEILSMYMNAVFFGSNAYGIKAAANTFFAKEPSDLNVQESALLVGVVNKPSKFNPVRHPEKSLKRRNHVLSQMNKYGFLGDRAYDSIVKLPIKLDFQTQDHNSASAPYFRDMLKRTMNAGEPKRKQYRYYQDFKTDSLLWADDALYGWLNKNFKPDGSKYNLDRDGLKIYTTLNSKMQRYAEEAVSEHLGLDLQRVFSKELKRKIDPPFSDEVPETVAENIMKQARRWSDRYVNMKRNGISESKINTSFDLKSKMRIFSWNSNGYIDTLMTPNDSIRYYKSFLRASLMAMEPETGHIKAYVGGPDYKYFKYDNARQAKRQVGSVIKPFLYTMAMQEGYTPCDKVVNMPQTFIIGDTTWTPESTDRLDWIGKTVTLKWGLTKSSNNISAYLMKQFGPRAMVDMCRRLGIKSYLPTVPSLCLGPADLTLYEMVAAYNTYPSRGVYVEPMFVTKIEDKDGNVLSNFAPAKREAISEMSAFLMVNLMQGVVNEGTAIRLRYKYLIGGELAGKTGTTNDQADGWFMGYTPKLTAGVWVGAEDRQVHFSALRDGGGSNMALPIWGIFMQKILKDGSLGISVNDKFVAPQGFNLQLDCSGGDEDLETGYSSSDDPFFN